MNRTSTPITYRVLVAVLAVVVLGLAPLIAAMLIPDFESEFVFTPTRFVIYLLVVSALVASGMYMAEQQRMWSVLDVQVKSALGKSVLIATVLIIVGLDVLIWFALLSDLLIRTKVIVAAILFHLLWVAGAIWLHKASATSVFTAVCGGFIGAVALTTSTVLYIVK